MRPQRRLGVLSDLHHDPYPNRQNAWINPYDPAGTLHRIGRALAWFQEEAVDLIVVTGDAVERPEPEAFDGVFRALAAARAPVAFVAGNHDWDDSTLARGKAAEHGILVLDSRPLDGLGLLAITAEPVDAGARRFRAVGRPDAGAPGVIASHFPLLSEAERLAAAGLPYPGDLVNRDEIADFLHRGAAHFLVLSGHIHARCSRSAGGMLQFSCGALIEPPHEAAIVTIGASLEWVERAVRRLGAHSEVEPVFSDDFERWESTDAGWQPGA